MKTTTKGTCGACFRLMGVGSDGLVVRHGWRESGGRRAGEYGRVYHSGACFGVGRLPFEVSAKCTEDFVEQILSPMGTRARAVIVHLESMPTLVYEGKTFAANFTDCRGHMQLTKSKSEETWDGYFRWCVNLTPGTERQEIKCHKEDHYGVTVPSYKQYHRERLDVAKRSEEDIKNDTLHCLGRIAQWKPVALVTQEKKPKTVHRRRDGGYTMMCQGVFISSDWTGASTLVNSEVTCVRCLKNMPNIPKKD